MKFDEHVDKLLKKYPLNEDLGNIFGTLGQMVKNKMKYILEPMTKPFNEAKPDKSKGDDIIIEMSDLLIRDQEISRKQLKFLKNGEQVPPNKLVSYNQLQGDIEGVNPYYDRNADIEDPDTNPTAFRKTISYTPKIKNIIQALDLNKYNLINQDKNIILGKIKEVLNNRKKKEEEYDEERTRAEMSPESLYKRYEFLIQKTYFVPFSKNPEEKIKWLFILAKPNATFEFKGELEGEEENGTSSTTKPSKSTPTSKTRTPAPPTTPSTSGGSTTTPSTSGAPTRTPTPTPRTRTPAPPTRVVRPRTP
jgi:hypothetical protein